MIFNLFHGRGLMPFFLKHHFDPDLDQDNLKPEEQADGSVDHYELNFVQNVEAGTVIAEWVEFGDSGDAAADPRFICEEMIFPESQISPLSLSNI